MKCYKNSAVKLLLILVFILLWTGCASVKTKFGTPAKIDFGILGERLSGLRENIRDDIRLSVGSFLDKTGQRKDADRARYSTAVTQGAGDLLAHLLFKALGPRRVIEREPRNLAMIREEYELSHKYNKQGMQIGLIQRGGPRAGLTGAEYIVTGAIIYYHVDLISGGGGINIDAIGAFFRTSVAKVALELRLIDMSTSEIVWSTIVENRVEGISMGADIFRFITSMGHEYLVQAEAGMAAQLPADYALHLGMEEGIASMITQNKDIFLKATEEKKG
jgi:curli production assembly/transport component CsgG